MKPSELNDQVLKTDAPEEKSTKTQAPSEKEKAEVDIAISRALVLGYLLRSKQAEFSIGTQNLANVLGISTVEINDSLMALVSEGRIKLTISRAVIQLGETEGG
jgi:DNA-binding transcriptional regulator LsrR (DeoR family)